MGRAGGVKMAEYDTLIVGGRVIDPANGVDELADVAVNDGLIAAVAAPGTLTAGAGTRVHDAAGQLVVPGLVDTHVHVYTEATPLGIPADEFCLARGSTTVVDLGSPSHPTPPAPRTTPPRRTGGAGRPFTPAALSPARAHPRAQNLRGAGPSILYTVHTNSRPRRRRERGGREPRRPGRGGGGN